MDPHPGDDLNNFCPRDVAKPVLVLHGRRSTFAWWPPAAVCEVCGAGPTNNGGYVGRVAGVALTYPAPETRFVCEPCARAAVGLKADDLTGHNCGPDCTDATHQEIQIFADAFAALSDEGRTADIAPDYARRGWRVSGVQEAIGRQRLKTVGGAAWIVSLVPARPTST